MLKILLVICHYWRFRGFGSFSPRLSPSCAPCPRCASRPLPLDLLGAPTSRHSFLLFSFLVTFSFAQNCTKATEVPVSRRAAREERVVETAVTKAATMKSECSLDANLCHNHSPGLQAGICIERMVGIKCEVCAPACRSPSCRQQPRTCSSFQYECNASHTAVARAARRRERERPTGAYLFLVKLLLLGLRSGDLIHLNACCKLP